MSWAEESDLLVGDVNFYGAEKSKYLDDAEDEILVALGRIYTLPLPDPLAEFVTRALKLIQSRLASGRLILAAAAGGEDKDLHAYGYDLVRLAHEELGKIGKDYEIPDATRYQVGEDRRPSITNIDTASPFDAYVDFAHKGNTSAFWDPVL